VKQLWGPAAAVPAAAMVDIGQMVCWHCSGGWGECWAGGGAAPTGCPASCVWRLSDLLAGIPAAAAQARQPTPAGARGAAAAQLGRAVLPCAGIACTRAPRARRPPPIPRPAQALEAAEAGVAEVVRLLQVWPLRLGEWGEGGGSQAGGAAHAPNLQSQRSLPQVHTVQHPSPPVTPPLPPAARPPRTWRACRSW
jgi:hypothetical protein